LIELWAPDASSLSTASDDLAVVVLQDVVGDPHVDGSAGGGDVEADLLPLRADHADGAGPAGGPPQLTPDRDPLLLLARERSARRALTRP
jgi:hypothetical protein